MQLGAATPRPRLPIDSRGSGQPQSDHLKVVVQPAGEGKRAIAHAFGDFLGRAASQASDDLEQPLLAEQLTVSPLGLGDAIGVEHQVVLEGEIAWAFA